jgi:hypothetical protein
MFYTYLWLREDGTPYYVGKGSGKRASSWHGRVGKAPKGYIVVYIAKDEADAFETEKLLIWYYGRKDLKTGCLRNLTDGGDNPPRSTPQSIAKTTATKKGKKYPKQSASMKGNHNAKGTKCSDENKKRLRVLFTGRGVTEETRRKVSESKKGNVVVSLEQRLAISKALTKTHCKKGHLLREGPIRTCLVCIHNRRTTQGRHVTNPGIDKPFCLRGHARTADNVYASGDCIVCAKARAKKFQRKNNECHQ